MQKLKQTLPYALMFIGILVLFVPLVLEIWHKGWGVFEFTLDWQAANARKQAMFWKYWEFYAGAFSLWGVGLLTLYLGDRR